MRGMEVAWRYKCPMTRFVMLGEVMKENRDGCIVQSLEGIDKQRVYSRETSRPNRRALIQSTATRTRLRAIKS
jgi:hypothetical protein